MTPAQQRFKDLTAKYAYPHGPSNKAELIDLIQAGNAVIKENPTDIDLTQRTSLAMQAGITASPLNDTYPALEQVSDYLVTFDDFELDQDEATAKQTLQTLQAYFEALPNQINTLIP